MGLAGLVNRIVVRNNEIFYPFQSGFRYEGSYSHCNVIVHSGFSTQSTLAQGEVKTGKYGPYLKYLQNIKQLLRYLKDSGELTIFAVEDGVFQGNVQNEEDLSPFDSSLLIVTKNLYGNVTEYIETQYGKKRQIIEILYSFLKDNGIHEARFAGEWAWWNGNACLGTLADSFYNAGFNIKGVEGCIYPIVPPPPETNNEVLTRLYGDTIKIPWEVPILTTKQPQKKPFKTNNETRKISRRNCIQKRKRA